MTPMTDERLDEIAKIAKIAEAVAAEPDHEEGLCRLCEGQMHIVRGYDPSALCDECAQKAAECLPSLLDALKKAEAERDRFGELCAVYEDKFKAQREALDALEETRRERDEARADAERMRGALPADVPADGLPRYGLRWNGPQTPCAVPMEDGYWTPWHLASARMEEIEAGAATLREAMRPVLDSLNEACGCLGGCIHLHARKVLDATDAGRALTETLPQVREVLVRCNDLHTATGEFNPAYEALEALDEALGRNGDAK